jgi:phage terminase Nu1 subunit (DNA packaging protein)
LIHGAPPVASSADRAALCTALNKSSEELAVMSRDINHLTQLLRQGAAQAAQAYAARHETLDRDVRSHLARAAAVLAELSTMRSPGGSRRSPR